MARRRNDFSAAFPLLTIFGKMVVALFKAFSRPSFTSINFARQGSGGRFRRVTQDEVDLAMQPVIDLVAEARELSKQSGDMPTADAEKIVAEAHQLGDRLDEACDTYERENFSFAYRRNAKRYERLIVSARRVARDLRKSEFEPLLAGRKNGDQPTRLSQLEPHSAADAGRHHRRRKGERGADPAAGDGL